jgi:3-deoxy-D-manno-octulosonate 8-phosphate phosphatase (KDO 8-P phosphatase)
LAPLSGLAANAKFAAAAAKVRLLGVDFDGVMTDNSVYVFEDGREAVRCSRLEGYGLRRLAAADVAAIIVSTETNGVVAARARKLDLPCLQNVADKATALQRLLDQRGLDWTQAAYIGNDVNDLEVLTKVGLAIVVADAHECVLGAGFFRTNRRGGDGAVREACDAIAAVKERT